MRVRFIATIASLLLFGVVPATAQAHDHSGGELRAYAHGTWASFVAMTDERSGLPADILNSNGRRACRPRRPTSARTCGAPSSPQRLGFIPKRELIERLSRTLASLERMERYEDTGQYYNWYDHRTGAKLTVWPPTPPRLTRSCPRSTTAGWPSACGSSRTASPSSRGRAGALYAAMDWGFYYRPGGQPRPVPLPARRPGGLPVLLRHRRQREPDRRLPRDRPRPAPAEGLLRALAHVPGHVRLQLPGDAADRRITHYFGVNVFEGAYPYNGTRLVPSWGGSMFEALMPALFVPEETWAPRSWGVEPPAHRAGADPPRHERGRLRLLGLLAREQAGGRLRRVGRRRRRHGSERDALQRGQHPGRPWLRRLPGPRPRSPTRRRRSTRTASSRRTPRSSRCATRRRRRTSNLRRLARDFPALYGRWGFRDSVNVQTERVSDAYLSLDQGMIMAALGNALGGDVLRRGVRRRHARAAAAAGDRDRALQHGLAIAVIRMM